jgi:hypothetical protein
MSSTANPFFATRPLSLHGRERPRVSPSTPSRHGWRRGPGAVETEAVEAFMSGAENRTGETLPATPTVNLLRVTLGVSDDLLQQLVNRDSVATENRRHESKAGAAFDHSAFYAVCALAAVIAWQLLA